VGKAPFGGVLEDSVLRAILNMKRDKYIVLQKEKSPAFEMLKGGVRSLVMEACQILNLLEGNSESAVAGICNTMGNVVLHLPWMAFFFFGALECQSRRSPSTYESLQQEWTKN